MNNDFLEEIRKDNKNYEGKMKSLIFFVKRGNQEKKIFKCLFAPSDIDIYITFPYFKSDAYYCGVTELPADFSNSKGIVNMVKKAKKSRDPVKFSYHHDGNVHFKRTNFGRGENRSETIVSLKASPITELKGGHIFTISFEGLDKFEDLNKSVKGNGDEKCLLRVPEDIINFEILAYASSSEKGLKGLVKKGASPWFVVKGKSADGKPVFLGVYAVLSRKSHIIDNNKNALFVLVGFDKSQQRNTGLVRSLYLLAR